MCKAGRLKTILIGGAMVLSASAQLVVAQDGAAPMLIQNGQSAAATTAAFGQLRLTPHPVATADVTTVTHGIPIWGHLKPAFGVSDAAATVQFTGADLRFNTVLPVIRDAEWFRSMELRSALHDTVPTIQGLRGALDSAIGRDAGLHAARLDIKVADRQVWKELLTYVPVVTASLQQTYLSPDDGSEIFDFDGSEIFDLTDRKNYVAISASVPIFNSGGRYYGIKAARSRRESVIYDALAARDQATMKLIERWTQAVSGSHDRNYALETIQRLKRLRSAVIAREKAGFASSYELAQVDADIAAARRTLASIEGALASSTDQLLHLSGQRPDKGEELPRFEKYMRDGREAFVQSARQTNPTLRSAGSRYRAELYATRSSMSRFLPSVNLTGEYRHYLDNTRQSSNDDNGLTVGIRLQVPLLDLASVAETTAQAARREAALYREVATLDAVEMEIESLWNDRDATIAMRAAAESEAAARKSSATSARSRFEKGSGSLEDAIREESALLNAQRTALQLAAQESVLAAKLLVLSGQFTARMLEAD